MAATNVSPAQAPEASAVELAIIAAAVDSLYLNESATRIVIQSPTTVFSRYVVGNEVVRVSGSKEIAEDMIRRNSVSVDLRGLARVLGSRILVSFVSNDSLRGLPHGNPDAYWRGFYAAFPGSKGLVTVSRPGIRADGRSAVVAIGKGCGGRCGAWGDAILRKYGDRWQVVRFVVHTMS